MSVPDGSTSTDQIQMRYDGGSQWVTMPFALTLRC